MPGGHLYDVGDGLQLVAERAVLEREVADPRDGSFETACDAGVLGSQASNHVLRTLIVRDCGRRWPPLGGPTGVGDRLSEFGKVAPEDRIAQPEATSQSNGGRSSSAAMAAMADRTAALVGRITRLVVGDPPRTG